MTRLGDAPLIGLAPMAGVGDMPMRALCYRMGAQYACTEMVSAVGWMCAKRDNAAYAQLLRTDPAEANTAVQLFGKDPAAMAEAAQRACELGRFTSIDINMGCPARKVTSTGEGSALLKTPDLAARIMRAVKASSYLPVTVKTRLGYDAASMNAGLLAQAAQDAGLAWICIHGRTREQMYAGHADWDAVGALRRDVRIPVLLNGDVTNAGEALSALARTGCDGLLIGRGAMGNPWLFREIGQALGGETPRPPTLAERLDTALSHIDGMVACKGEKLAVREMRTHIGHYIAGLRGAAAMRRALNTARTTDEQKTLLRALFSGAAQEDEP